jgi:hypothetical protein
VPDSAETTYEALRLYMESCDQLRTKQSRQLLLSPIQIDTVVKENRLSPQDLQARYAAALSRIGGAPTKDTAKKHTPIFKRQPAITETESIQDATNALAAIWKLARS